MSLYRDLVSGASGGASAILCSQPLDVIRVRLQQSPTLSGSAYRTASGLLRQEGFIALWRGTTPPLIGVGVLMSVLRSAQQATGRLLRVDGHGTFSQYAIMGAAGGLAQAPLAVPIEVVKVQQQLERGVQSSAIQTIRRLVLAGGISALFRGWVPLMARDVLGYGFFLGLSDSVLTMTSATNRRSDVTFTAVLAAGCGLGWTYWAVAFPFDVIKTRLQGDSMHKPQFKGVFDCARKALHAGGIRSLYQGLGLTLLYSVPKNGAKLLGFEFVARKMADDENWVQRKN
jgi:solute carrier family 25 carnitine/acylcarnitine transporter 20/29